MIRPANRIKSLRRSHDPYQKREEFIRLDKNERSYDFTRSFVRGLRRQLVSSTISVYPELQPLYRRLARWLNLSKDEIYVCAGSEYGVKAIYEAYIDPGDRVLLHSPSYALFNIYAQLSQAKIEVQEFQPDLSFDFSAYLKRINSRIKMVVLENPNGFIGNGYAKQELEKIIKKAHSHNVLVVVDEAYYFFHDITALRFIKKYDNIIVLRTFSKALGAAGIRMGYLAGCRNIIDNIRKVQPMHEISQFTFLVANHLLSHIGEMERYVTSVKKCKKFIINELSKRKIESRDTQTNFILVKWPGEKNMQNKFEKEGILIRRPFGQDFLRGWSRITIGNAKQMRKLLRVIDNVFAKQSR